MGADFNFAWPMAQMAVLGAKAGVSIMHGKKLAAAAPDQRPQMQQALEDRYTQEFLNPMIAAENGYIDAIIAPDQTRSQIIQALHISKDKVEKNPDRKHGNMPLWKINDLKTIILGTLLRREEDLSDQRDKAYT